MTIDCANDAANGLKKTADYRGLTCDQKKAWVEAYVVAAEDKGRGVEAGAVADKDVWDTPASSGNRRRLDETPHATYCTSEVFTGDNFAQDCADLGEGDEAMKVVVLNGGLDSSGLPAQEAGKTCDSAQAMQDECWKYVDCYLLTVEHESHESSEEHDSHEEISSPYGEHNEICPAHDSHDDGENSKEPDASLASPAAILTTMAALVSLVSLLH